MNFKETMSSNDADQWLKAMNEELHSINKNIVQELTDLPSQRKAISCKWVLRKKFKANESLDKYKVRLVAKGFTQQTNVDFIDTYSLVEMFASVRLIMFVIANIDLELHHLDVKTTFYMGN